MIAHSLCRDDVRGQSRPRRWVFFVGALFIAERTLAHDFWLEPSTFRPAPGETVSASLRVGEHFLGDPIPRSAQLIESFTVRDAAGERPIVGDESTDPAGYFKAGAPGPMLIGYQGKPSRIWLPAERFEAYLRLEGLESIVALRAARGETGNPARERFSRHAKALLYSVPSARGPRVDRPFGFPLEIVSEVNPYTTTKAVLPFRVLYQSKPLAGALVIALCRDAPMAALRARSDASGRVTFALPKSGVWLVKSVHMIPSPAGSNADWDSLWASLTFEWKGGPLKVGNRRQNRQRSGLLTSNSPSATLASHQRGNSKSNLAALLPGDRKFCW